MRNDFCENYLMHADRANHKYVAKIKLSSGKFYYFYNLLQYQNYLKKLGKNNNQQDGQNALKNPNENKVSPEMKRTLASDKAVQNLVNKKMEGNTIEEKTKHLKSYMNKGSEVISSKLSNETKTTATDTSDSKKSSKSSGSGGSSSKSSKGIGGKGAKSKSSKEKSSKEKASGGSKSNKSSSSKETKDKNKKVVLPEEQMTIDKLKSMYKKKDDDVSTINGTSDDLKKKMLDKYDEGAFGYLSAGDKVYESLTAK